MDIRSLLAQAALWFTLAAAIIFSVRGTEVGKLFVGSWERNRQYGRHLFRFLKDIWINYYKIYRQFL